MSEKINTYPDLLGYIQEITDQARYVAIKKVLDQIFADYTILKVTTEAEVEESTELSPEEKDYCIGRLRSGKRIVYILSEALPWEH